MIVVDLSAIIGILDEEGDAARYAEALAEADTPLISAPTLVEADGSGANQTAQKFVANGGVAARTIACATPKWKRLEIRAEKAET
jgi:uncharacterized protein with PIN domain